MESLHGIGHDRVGEAMTETYELLVGVYRDVTAAKQDYQAVKDRFFETNAIGVFDAAVIGTQDSGKAKIFRKPELSTRHGALVGAGWGLATGLVVVLVPDAALGTGFLSDDGAANVGVEAIAGHVSAGMRRRDLKTLGEALDSAEAALVIAAEPDLSAQAREVISRADGIESADVCVDKAQLERDIRAAQREAGASPRSWRTGGRP